MFKNETTCDDVRLVKRGTSRNAAVAKCIYLQESIYLHKCAHLYIYRLLRRLASPRWL